MIEFNHKEDSFFGALGVNEERFKEMNRKFKERIGEFSNTGTKSVTVEQLVTLIEPKSPAELFVIGILLGGYDAHLLMFRKMAEDMKTRIQAKDDDVDDF